MILENGSLTLHFIQRLSRTNALTSIPQSSLSSDFSITLCNNFPGIKGVRMES